MANQYNSYYLYQQYEKRGSQDWLPCYPNIFSVDGGGTMPLVMKKENDPDCGYVPPVEPMYRWYNIPITTDYICDECPVVQYRWENMNPSTDYYCDGTTKYYKQKRQYSYDSGTTWYDVTPPEYQQGSVYQQQSTDCGYVPPIEPQYRTTSGTPYCEGVDKYVEVYSQVSYDGGITWSTTATTPTLVEHNSVECGYIEPQYRTTSGTPYCSGETGYDKYVTVYSQVSYDGGITWETTATTQTLLEHNSADCGYSPKLFATYSNGTTRTVDCDSIRSLGRAQTQPSGMTSAMIGNCTAAVNGGAFSGCSTLTSVTISTGDTTLAFNEKSFIDCTNLLSIELSNRVTGIYQYSFSGCTSLTGLTIPSSVTSILNGAFSGCTSLTSVTMEATTPPTLGSYVFNNTNNCPIYVPCESISLYKSASGWSNYAERIRGCSEQYRTTSGTPYCSGETGYDKYVDIYNQVSYDGGSTWETTATTPTLVEEYSQDCGWPPSQMKFYAKYSDSTTYSAACDSNTSLTTDDTKPAGYTYSAMTSAYIGDYCITSIGSDTFRDCTSLTSIDIPNNVTSIGERVFQFCSSLTSCTIGSGVTSIAGAAFDSCTSLTSIDIPNSVTSIGEAAFMYCTGLTSIDISNSVTSIGDFVFYGCRSLTSVTVNATTPPTLGEVAFDNTNNCPIYVPSASVNAYKSASGWSDYASRIQAIP